MTQCRSLMPPGRVTPEEKAKRGAVLTALCRLRTPNQMPSQRLTQTSRMRCRTHNHPSRRRRLAKTSCVQGSAPARYPTAEPPASVARVTTQLGFPVWRTRAATISSAAPAPPVRSLKARQHAHALMDSHSSTTDVGRSRTHAIRKIAAQTLFAFRSPTAASMGGVIRSVTAATAAIALFRIGCSIADLIRILPPRRATTRVHRARDAACSVNRFVGLGSAARACRGQEQRNIRRGIHDSPAVLSAQSRASAAESAATKQSEAGTHANPFATTYDHGPGLMRLGLRK